VTAAVDMHNHEQELVEAMARFSKDPLGYVLYAFQWGEGELAGKTGPEPWQAELLGAVGKGLLTISEAIQIAVSSGHGIGKSAFVSWLILWALSTFPGTKGVVTANTASQLATKTWPELAKWHRLCIVAHWFNYTATSIHSVEPGQEKTWRVDAVTWSDTNTEAFAGLHNQGKRILLVFDEASGISDKVWEVAEGALTDENTEIIWAAFGNPTRSSGRFHSVCFGKLKHRWISRCIDSRTVSHTNKKQIQKWIEDYGVDSDFVRVRVRGLPPNASELQFIPTNTVEAARGKSIHESAYAFAPKIIGVDPAYSGADETAIYLRQGLAVQKLMTVRNVADDLTIAGYVAKFEDEHQADAVFVDMGYGTGIVSGGRSMGRNWQIVSFGSKSNKEGFANKRAEMWGDMKKWLAEGGAIPDDQDLADQMTAPEYYINLRGEILLESKDDMKARGLASPDRADAVALTFAYPVQKKSRNEFGHAQREFTRRGYDPLA
jgi:hypothetical protein